MEEITSHIEVLECDKCKFVFFLVLGKMRSFVVVD